MREGATSAILQLGSMLEAEAATPPGPGVLYKFYDLGNVDVAHVDFPYGLQAGTPIEYFPMVNGVQDFVWPQPLFQREADLVMLMMPYSRISGNGTAGSPP